VADWHIVLWPPPWSGNSILKKMATLGWGLAIAPVIVLTTLIVFVSIPLQRIAARPAGPRMSRLQAGAVLESFADGTAGPWDWDDFVSVPIGDPRLDAIRLRCSSLEEEFPPERPGQCCGEGGLLVLRQLAAELRRSDG
jgi:hypothetical protein